MNTVRLTPEEREAHDYTSLIMSIPHTIAEFVNDDGEIDWETFKKNEKELYDMYCELTIEELNQCLDEAYKIGGALPGYGAVIDAFRKQQEDIRNTQIQF